MNRRHRLLATVAVGAVFAVPAAPAHALPYCGGTWTNYARCSFEAPAGAFVVQAALTSRSEGTSVSVRVFVEIGGVQYQVGGCGPSAPSCSAVVDTPFDGWVHQCEVHGSGGGGTYLCADPPYLPLPV